MLVTKISRISGKTNTMFIDADENLLLDWLSCGGVGMDHIQNVFPNLNADEREFLLTGITPQEWSEIFGDDE